MVTMIWMTSLIAAGITCIDQLRRPASEWTAADRDRSYWVSATVCCGLLCLGVVAAVAYAVGVVPRFASGLGSDAAFSKQPTGQAGPAPVASPPASLWAAPPAAAAAPSPAPLPEVQESRKLIVEFDDA